MIGTDAMHPASKESGVAGRSQGPLHGSATDHADGHVGIAMWSWSQATGSSWPRQSAQSCR